MIVFLDFEASSLGKHGFPIEVGWAAEDGTEASHLIRPAPGWEEWSEEAESIHGITRDQLAREGTPHDSVARALVEALTGHDLYASAPSWDGHWLSLLLRAGGFNRKTLTLRDSDELHDEAAMAAFRRAGLDLQTLADRIHETVAAAKRAIEDAAPPAHRALADARQELRLWREVARRAEAAARG
ncbi:transcriptional regulator [Roseomonas sp. CCTCC AB2023176]|uniref:transcriptional regulator n=1 Tax=Roseomonas sp. CCTCC AB2023176 TaxID=3342640 RepID=UPI0035DBC5D3